MGLVEELPIELECWLLKWGILPLEHRQRKPDVVWPVVKEDILKVSKGWKPDQPSQEPPF